VYRYIKTGGHGGHRGGAGRPPSLGKVDRLLLGAQAETERQISGQALPTDLSDDEIKKSRKALDSVPVPDRKNLPVDAQEHHDWLKNELDGRRVIKAERRLLGDVYAKLAAEASEKHGKPITLRQVRRCHDEYRASQKGPKTK
jgi:hypothetical protein